MEGIIKFSKEEKAAISRLLFEDDRLQAVILAIFPYLLPTMLLAAYGIYYTEYVACSLSYICLLGLSIWYLKISGTYAKMLKSTVRKYEVAVKALDFSDE